MTAENDVAAQRVADKFRPQLYELQRQMGKEYVKTRLALKKQEEQAKEQAAVGEKRVRSEPEESLAVKSGKSSSPLKKARKTAAPERGENKQEEDQQEEDQQLATDRVSSSSSSSSSSFSSFAKILPELGGARRLEKRQAVRELSADNMNDDEDEDLAAGALENEGDETPRASTPTSEDEGDEYDEDGANEIGKSFGCG